MSQITRSPTVLVEAADLASSKEDDVVTLLDWGNVVLESLTRQGGKVTAASGRMDLANKSFGNTVKLTWIAPEDATVQAVAIEYTPLINIACVFVGACPHKRVCRFAFFC